MSLSATESANYQPLLIELLTEELPPKALNHLSQAFAASISESLLSLRLIDSASQCKAYATPRRLAVHIDRVADSAAPTTERQKLMPVSVALNERGEPTPALLKKLTALGISVSAVADFERAMDGKSEMLFFQHVKPGASLHSVLADVINTAIKKMPIPKVMHWADSRELFVRPVHGVLLLHGAKLIEAQILGLNSGRSTFGHRFLSSGPIEIDHADHYGQRLRAAHVIVDFTERRNVIVEQLLAAAKAQDAVVHLDDALLDEVTALVEWPQVYQCQFEADFLAVPQECLILTMQQNQKYFPLFDAAGTLRNAFLIVSNMVVDDPQHIIEGNARVVRPRLADARFFYQVDCEHSFESRLEKLAQVIYHNKLGSQRQRIDRLCALGGKIAALHSSDPQFIAQVSRAALLAKNDLVSDMIGEFPELQGIMGGYYARKSGEDEIVAEAIAEHYRPRFAGDDLPQQPVACIVALADKLDALAGFFAIDQRPTGDKDPFGLRRAALGIIRILREKQLPFALPQLIDAALVPFTEVLRQQKDKTLADVALQLTDFIYERLRHILRETIAPDIIEAILVQRPQRLDLIDAKIQALLAFRQTPQARVLAAANKRISNILRQNSAFAATALSVPLMRHAAELALYETLQRIEPGVRQAVANTNYQQALMELTAISQPIDEFFTAVMVMDEDPAIRQNRLSLLAQLSELCNLVAEIGQLEVQ